MRYFSILPLLVGLAHAGSEMRLFFGSNSTVMAYDTAGKLDQTTVAVKSIGGTFKYTLFSTPIPASPKLFAGIDAGYFLYDTLYGGAGFVNPFLELKIPFITLRGGFNLDLTKGSGFMTDGSSALIAEADVGIPFLHGKITYAHTFQSIPNVFIFRTGAGIKIGLGNLTYVKGGLDIVYRKGLGNPDTYNFSILPYVGFKFPPIEAEAMLGLRDEYGLYGISLKGKNTPAPGVGILFTIRVK